MEQTFAALLAAYVVAEFPLRPHRADHTMGFWYLLVHLVAVAALTTVVLGVWQPAIVVTVAVAHLVTATIPGTRHSLPEFTVEQVIHLAVLAALAWLFPTALADGWARLLGANLGLYLACLAVVTGLIVSVQVGGIIIGTFTEQFRVQVDSELTTGLANGSLYIGWLERSLVMLLVMIDQTAGVGFLITAKSILRFSDAQNPGHRKASEYIIIGTFLSFGWGLLVSFGTHWAFHHWLP